MRSRYLRKGEEMKGERITGRCMCGAVTVTSTLPKPALRACHCEMCRRQTSGAFMSIANDAQDVRAEGPVEIYRSSDWAERAFCRTCGSTLWYGTLADGARHLSAGLFPDAMGAPLKLEFFTDNCPEGYAFQGTHKKLSKEDTIALFAPHEGEAR